MKNIDAVLFDMDGVLVDSEFALRTCCINKMKDYGINAVHEDFIAFTGMGEDAFIGGVVRKHGKEYSPEMKDEIYDVYDREGRPNIAVAPCIGECLKYLRGKYKIAVASAADRRKVEINLSVIGVEVDFFDAVITGSDVVNKKPDPEIYLCAARAVGVPPEKCIVIEDAVSGVKSAKAAGCLCVGVSGTFTKDELTAAGADMFVENTCDLKNIL